MDEGEGVEDDGNHHHEEHLTDPTCSRSTHVDENKHDYREYGLVVWIVYPFIKCDSANYLKELSIRSSCLVLNLLYWKKLKNILGRYWLSLSSYPLFPNFNCWMDEKKQLLALAVLDKPSLFSPLLKQIYFLFT